MITKVGKEIVSGDANAVGNLTFIRQNEVCRITGLPRSTLYELMSRGAFPKPVPISPGRVGWIESEVRAWQLARIAEREAKQSEAA